MKLILNAISALQFIECTMSSSLPVLPDGISCYNPESCSDVSCCMEISKLNNRAIEVTVEFNECSNFLKMTVERMPMIIYLHNFVYGELMHILNLNTTKQ